MNSLTFVGRDAITLFNFLSMFQVTWDFNEIHEVAAKWLLRIYICDTTCGGRYALGEVEHACYSATEVYGRAKVFA